MQVYASDESAVHGCMRVRKAWFEMKKWSRILCIGLCIMLTTCFSIPSQAVTLAEITSDSIKEKEGQISNAQSEKNELQASLSDVKKIKKELEAVKNDLTTYVTQLDGQMQLMQDNIANLEIQIQTKETEITQTQIELDEAVATEQEQYAAMKQRIKFMYEKGDDYYMEMLLSAEDFSDFLNKADYIELLSSYDRKMLDQYVLTAEYVRLCKEQLEVEKQLLDEAKTDVEIEKAAIEELISEKQKQITNYAYDISNKEKAIEEYEADIAEQNEIIKELEAAVAAEKQAILNANKKKITYDGGLFAWPAPSYKRISDDYGYRIHPTLGVKKFHNGIDLASASGTPILAAYDGEVVASAYSSSMGNYIMIDHGNTLYTIYMHASALYVSKGDIVTKGQHIAAVGSTGRSTGPHLHFGVRLNGEYVSPWSYFGN